MYTQIKKASMLLGITLLSFFSLSVHAQEQDPSANKKVSYGLQLGFTESKVDLYHVANADVQESLYVPGFRIAVVTDFQLGRCFSLRVLPGMSLFSRSWQTDYTGLPIPPVDTYKVESVLGEVPVDVKFHPFRMGNWEPYLTSGLCYSFDFATLSKASGYEHIRTQSPHNLRYTCGLGLDCHTRYLTLGLELKAALGLIPSSNAPSSNAPSSGTPSSATLSSNPFYFHPGPTFSLALNIEA